MENLQPGPLDNSILYDQESHISKRVWHGKEAGPLRCIPTSNHDSWEINDRREGWTASQVQKKKDICCSEISQVLLVDMAP
ncbi:hypothetical protein MRB53_023869 [Persea americana]|uniref:Uncharacterized protein n=1 Tax=Persea americana TaxID=3435 RepID=A0ACC2LBG7_PERAE|nr:hypothetical protein MRB53_023869 [Persea americana]